MKQVDIVLAGIGGYGGRYVNSLLGDAKHSECEPYRVVGAVEVNLASCDQLNLFEEANIPIYTSLDEFYANHTADLAVLATPIYLHYEHVEICIRNGSNVLCEKPLCSSLQEICEFEKLAKSTDKFICIGYQMNFSPAVQQLKQDIASGLFGKARVLKTLVHYPRGEKYYARNSWAGKKTTKDGRLVFDSPMHNAVAHHLNNMLFIMGDKPHTSIVPKTVQAELYRANPDVEYFDTVALRCLTDTGIPILYYTSHALNKDKNIGPYNVYCFEKATVFHDNSINHEAFFALFHDGSVKQYESLTQVDGMQKVWDCIEAVRGGSLPLSRVETAVPEVLCANGADLSHPVSTIPEKFVTRIGELGARMTHIEGLEDGLLHCFENGILPSEAGIPWAVPGKTIEVQELLSSME